MTKDKLKGYRKAGRKMPMCNFKERVVPNKKPTILNKYREKEAMEEISNALEDKDAL